MKFKNIIPLIMLSAFIFCGNTSGRNVTMMFTGDIIMHIPVKNVAAARNIVDKNKKSLNHGGFSYLFERIAPLFRTADIACGNMEFPVSPPYKSVPWEFNCRPEVLDAMKASGFTMMHLANNHVLDQKEKGIVNTIGYLKEKKLDYIGVDLTEISARAGIVKEIRGMKAGFAGYTSVMNYPFPKNPKGYYINDFRDLDKVKADVISLRKRADYVVLVAHIGDEYALVPSKETRAAVKFLAEAGADLIIGHHPHIVQPVEKILTSDKRVCLVFYSLGNFISNQSGVIKYGKNESLSTRDSAVVKIVYTPAGMMSEKKIMAELIPITTLNDTDEKGKRRIQTVEMKEETAHLEKRMADSKNPAEIQRIKKRIEELKSRRASLKKAFYRYGDVPEVLFVE